MAAGVKQGDESKPRRRCRLPRLRATLPLPCAPKVSRIRRRGRHLSPIYTPARAPKAPGLPARAPLASPPRRTRARPGRKRTFPFTTLPAKMKKNAPPGRKTYLVTRHPPRTIKKQAADSGEKRSSPLPDDRHKNKKQDARSGRPASLDAATT